MRSLHVILAVLACVLSACDAHDYWFIPDAIKVSSEEGVLTASNQETFKQDLFVRYQLDYELQNLSQDQDTEVVVSATSYVNSIVRATGQKVYHLDVGESAQGILTSSQLELGNELIVSLSCCETSQCSRKDVVCSNQADKPGMKEILSYCDNSCQNTLDCINQCPADNVCTKICNSLGSHVSDCRELFCIPEAGLSTCANECQEDSECLENCIPAPECATKCMQQIAGCFMNCVATWTQCEEEIYVPDADTIPCALCGKDGFCKTNFDIPTNDELFLYSEGGAKYGCSVDCRKYPEVCMSECSEKYGDDDDARIDCSYTCLQQHLFWCNDYTIPYDYVDAQYKQPCCFSNYCNNELVGVIKTFDVECYSDSECKSGRYCSAEGVCVSDELSGCAQNSRPPSFPMILLISFISIIALRRKARYVS